MKASNLRKAADLQAEIETLQERLGAVAGDWRLADVALDFSPRAPSGSMTVTRFWLRSDTPTEVAVREIVAAHLRERIDAIRAELVALGVTP